MFPLIDFPVPMLSILPVEMLALILRYLDPESLLNAVLANKHFMKVCRGDPILRERLRAHIRKEKELEKLAILNARRGIVVTRADPARMFSSNGNKSISVEKVRPIRVQHTQTGLLRAKLFKIVPEVERVEGGGKLRKQRKARVEPYKTVRC